MDKKIFVVSDTWFNRPIKDKTEMSVTDYNNEIIKNWNDTVSNSDDVYVLGGLGISDLYSIMIKLNGTIHILNNFYTNDEREFIEILESSIINSVSKDIYKKILFESDQILILNDEDIILSYFPLSYWYGKDTGTLCFHGLCDSNFKDGHINCSIYKNSKPLDIREVKRKLNEFSDTMTTFL